MRNQPGNLQQLLAASTLIVTLEKLCTSGVLPEDVEQNVRVIVVQACKAFGIKPLAERGCEIVPFPGTDTGAFS